MGLRPKKGEKEEARGKQEGKGEEMSGLLGLIHWETNSHHECQRVQNTVLLKFSSWMTKKNTTSFFSFILSQTTDLKSMGSPSIRQRNCLLRSSHCLREGAIL